MAHQVSEPTSSMHLYRVLEDEYINLYGPLPVEYPWLFLQSHIKDRLSLLQKIKNPNPNGRALDKYLHRKFHDIFDHKVKRLQLELKDSDRKLLKEELDDKQDRLNRGDYPPDCPNADKLAKRVQQLEAKLNDEHHTDPKRREFIATQLAHVLDLKNLQAYEPNDPRVQELTHALIELLNKILTDRHFYCKDHFLGVNIQNDTQRLITEQLTKQSSTRPKSAQQPAGQTATPTDVTQQPAAQAESEKSTAICRINRFLLEDAFPDELVRRDVDDLEAAHRSYIAAIYSAIHKRERSALCLSGGGIRSATFNLGILQGLARHGLLDKFDYLSTVSGGGYIGSWLSSWIHRETGGLETVINRLSQKPESVLQPEPEPIRHLRDYSNYLSPRYGLLSADTWTLVAIVARNLLLNWLVFIPLLTAVIMTPRLYVSALTQSHRASWIPVLIGIAITGKLIAIAYLAGTLPSSGRHNNSQKEFLFFGLIPMVLSVSAGSLAWAWCQWADFDWESERTAFTQQTFLNGRNVIIGTILIGLSGLAVYSGLRLRRGYNPFQQPWWKTLIMTVCLGGVVTLVSAAIGFIIWQLSGWRALNPVVHPHAFACLAVPLMLLLYCLGGTLIAGFTTKWTREDDLEWWARCGAWILVVTIGWAMVTLLVVFGPTLPGMLRWPTTWSDWQSLAPALATGLGLISGAVTLLGGFSSGTPAQRKRGTATDVEATKERPTLLHRITPLAAPAFCMFIIVVLSLGTNWLLVRFASLLVWLAAIGNSVSQTFTYWVIDMRLVASLNSFLASLPDSFTMHSNANYWLAHKNIIWNTPFRLALTLWLLLIVVGWIMARVINTNIFSIHSLYGNRLKRAYLGAARLYRTPHTFTGFDSTDDLQIHELRAELFNGDSFRNFQGLAYKLKEPAPDDSFSSYLREKLSPNTVQMLDRLVYPQDPPIDVENALIEDLNRLLYTDSLYDQQRYPTEKLKEQTETLLARPPLDESRVVLNRWLLDDAYTNEIKPRKPPRLLHVVNIALNIVRSHRLAWQERKAETFTVSPLHSGNFWLRYRRSRYYGGDNGISLGTAFTISGAAASPNMGYMVSSPLVSFLMAMFNVRLGWWLGNPGTAGNLTYRLAVPRFTFGPIVQEALSLTDDHSRYVYLSDGGHFENLGLYEMVLRRCKVIVVSDATTDPNYNYDSFGRAVGKIRVDLGIPIEMENFDISNKTPENRYFAIGKIKYSCVDDDGTDGTLVYIKASLCMTEPRDIINYSRSNDTFPQEPISDQFFVESQFESYRMLGSYIVSSMCEGSDGDRRWQANGLGEFVDRLRESPGRRRRVSTNGQPSKKQQPSFATATAQATGNHKRGNKRQRKQQKQRQQQHEKKVAAQSPVVVATNNQRNGEGH